MQVLLCCDREPDAREKLQQQSCQQLVEARTPEDGSHSKRGVVECHQARRGKENRKSARN